ncbi:hypothetical protein P9112_004229 [Eukaryota sp. TZLM1-RC]
MTTPQPYDGHVEPHVDSYNFFLNKALHLIPKLLTPLEFELTSYSNIKLRIDSINIHEPSRPASSDALTSSLFPRDAREGGVTYGGILEVDLTYQIQDLPPERISRRLGVWPIMLRSSLCHLSKLDSKALCKAKETLHEPGGYFIINGLERLIRLLILPRRHFPLAMTRSSWVNRGPRYTAYGVSMRCVLEDESSLTNVLHYLDDGTITLRFNINRAEYFVSLAIILRALIQLSDRKIFDIAVNRAHPNDTDFVIERMELLLQGNQNLSLYNSQDAKAFLGRRFRTVLELPKSWKDVEVGGYVLENFILVHLGSFVEKFSILMEMLRKLYALVNGTILPDNGDATSFHELLLPGHLASMVLRESLINWMKGIRRAIEREENLHPETFTIDHVTIKKCVDRAPGDFGRKFEYLLSTGNLRSDTGLDLMQQAGFSIVAERLNQLRFLSHFRSVHRGQFFTEMKTTSVRKLLPESWGFLCPVHTPDGSPCGLLLHLAIDCKVSTERVKRDVMIPFLIGLGMMTNDVLTVLPPKRPWLPVVLDGSHVGFVQESLMMDFTTNLRRLKVSKLIPETTEIACVTPDTLKVDPGVYLFTTPSRFVRKVYNNNVNNYEYLGSFEQAYLSVGLEPGANHSHTELKNTSFLSFVARLTPFSDFNQSPRNMYQCQMAKQSMATPVLNYLHRVDNKLYRLLFPARPLVRTKDHDSYSLYDYPGGFNAVVAVLAHTGYSMEDACIINESSYNRGLAHGSVYTTMEIDLGAFDSRPNEVRHVFSNVPIAASGALGSTLPQLTEDGRFIADLEADGIISSGVKLTRGSVLAVSVDTLSGKPKIHRYKKDEDCIVDSVTLVGALGHSNATTGGSGQSKKNASSMFSGPLRKITLKLRYSRNPMVGDKFSSRHGQKGVTSLLWPQEDMPFTADGISPDIIINPHAFPSRMTIGMLIESMAGKSGCLHGVYQDGTPFQFSEDQSAIDFFGNQLAALGYEFYGQETMYCGLTGNEFSVRIFIGVVHYQRLRHMVSDKFQVRATGPINQVTRQPVKGRKVGGGIRFGEMERDAFIAHSSAFLLQDRLLNCSDRHFGFVCNDCGSLISCVPRDGKLECKQCGSSLISRVRIPFVFQYLVAELAAMNIKLTLGVK